jgi:hypothetical protein
VRVALESAREEIDEVWGVRRGVAVLIFALPIAGAAADVVLAQVDRSFLVSLAREDSLIEWLQFLAFATGGAFALLVASQLRRRGLRWQGLAYGGFAVCCFFVAGEELNWGQRLFGFETPELFREISREDEVKVHDAGKALDLFIAAQAVVGAYGSLGAWLIHLRGRAPAALFVPPLFLTSAFLVGFAWRAAGPLVPDDNLYSVIYGEWSELCLAFGLAAFAALNFRRLARQRDPESVEDRFDVAQAVDARLQ